jgi:carboxypeptidase C (cathepsin A)
MLYSLVAFVVALAFARADYGSDALADEVTNLPGLNEPINFRQFSGYLSIGDTKQIHYWFVESEKSPSTDPLVFWTNGGPGCSGLLGFMTEQGPFRPDENGNLILNQYAWNTIANMVFIEQPAGVGFSYANDTAQYHTNDDIAAEDNYKTIQAFLDRFPEYRPSDLYISSESYGGHYMPQLALTIVQKNEDPSNVELNFKGFLVGNPYTDFNSGTPALLQTLWGHQLVDKPTWDKYTAQCLEPKIPNTQACEILALEMELKIGNLNVYALDYPVCVDTTNPARFGRAQRWWFLWHSLPERLRKPLVGDIHGYNPCTETYSVTYLNRDDVKAAIHVDSSIEWEECSYTLRYEMRDEFYEIEPIYNTLLDGDYGLNILVYSGDDDSVCATVGTQDWIYDLGYKTTSLWKTWYLDGQTAGFVTKFEVPLTFVTVHAAGHEVPAYKPKEALDLFQKYLDGTWFQQ